MTAVNSYTYSWNEPRKAIDPGSFGSESTPETELARLIARYAREEEATSSQAAADNALPPLVMKAMRAGERAEILAEELKRLALNRVDPNDKKLRRELDPPVQLRALPTYLREPLQKQLSFLYKKQKQAIEDGKPDRPAHRYILGKLTRILERIEQINDRFLTPGYQRLVARERLDALLDLPQLSKRQTQTAATLTAGALKGEYDRLSAQHGEAMTISDAIDIYQKLARMALLLNITPPAWEALRNDTNRRTSPDVEKLPGAFLRLTCQEWWWRQLWRQRRIWREEQLRAACLVSRKTSSYMSKDALGEFREQRRRMRDFLKSYELVNEDGFTIDLEEAYYSGNSCPKHRRFEMMANMKGLELIAEARGDEAVFLTVTTPSRFHATTMDGYPNPKWDGSTIRDSSNYLVNTFFAAVRKKLNREKLRWYGIRVAEPHHDGTVHWHMMIFAHPEEREAIEHIVREIAIRDDRHELGSDITPRFKSELITAEKGTPTGYIATYIGKNLDGGAVKGNDPKTGEPRKDDESGLEMQESVERAVGWAGLHGVRQFQFFGIPSRQVWRELRRLAVQMERAQNGPRRLSDPAMDDVLVAADAGCFASYIMKQGGVLVPRKDYVVRTAYDLADKPNDYGETATQIYGVWSPQLGDDSRICTHPDNWKLVKKNAKPTDSATSQGVDFDVQGGNAAPWTRGNNCPHVQNTNNNGTSIATPAASDKGQSQEPLTAAPPGITDSLISSINHQMRDLRIAVDPAIIRSIAAGARIRHDGKVYAVSNGILRQTTVADAGNKDRPTTEYMAAHSLVMRLKKAAKQSASTEGKERK